MNRILITGSNGQLGFELKRTLCILGEIISLGRAEVDLINPERLQVVLNEVKPNIIVNAAAYTNVDQAESDRLVALAVNGHAPGVMAAWVEKNNGFLVHYSTDYVFDGKKKGVYHENDDVNPLSYYGLSKLLGEQAVRQHTNRHLILRTSWLVGRNGGNFLKKIMQLAAHRQALSIVSDQFGTPTPARMLADVTGHILRINQQEEKHVRGGTYHVTTDGLTSWYDYAKYVVELANKRGLKLELALNDIMPISSSEYKTSAIRPLNSKLCCEKLKKHYGLILPDWKSGIEYVFEEIFNN